MKVFVSHGGLLSTIETIYYGLPMLGIPVFADQKRNMAIAAEKGYAINLPLSEVTENTFLEALQQILNNHR